MKYTLSDRWSKIIVRQTVIRWSVLPWGQAMVCLLWVINVTSTPTFFPLLDIMLQWPRRIPICIVLHRYNVGHIRCIWHTTLIENITPLTHYPLATVDASLIFITVDLGNGSSLILVHQHHQLNCCWLIVSWNELQVVFESKYKYFLPSKRQFCLPYCNMLRE